MFAAIKKNPALSIGLIIPLLMLILLGGFPFVATLFVSGPEYNIIYSVRNYQTDGKLGVVDGKLQLQVYNRNNTPIDVPAIYLLDVKTGISTLLNSPFTHKEESTVPAHETRTIVFNEVPLKQLDKSFTAPDGYKVMTEGDNTLFLFPLFFGGHNSNTMSISKLGRVEKFQLSVETYRGAKFEGWVIP